MRPDQGFRGNRKFANKSVSRPVEGWREGGPTRRGLGGRPAAAPSRLARSVVAQPRLVRTLMTPLVGLGGGGCPVAALWLPGRWLKNGKSLGRVRHPPLHCSGCCRPATPPAVARPAPALAESWNGAGAGWVGQSHPYSCGWPRPATSRVASPRVAGRHRWAIAGLSARGGCGQQWRT